MQNENAIQTINLTKIFKSKIQEPGTSYFKRREISVKAIDNLDFEIRKGELFGLLGPNGAGKTTLVKMLCTLLPPDKGTALINGYDIIKEQMKVKRSLGTLFSVGERGFFWRLTGFRNLEFFASIYNVPRNKRQERIMEVLKLVGLEENGFIVFQKYSGGMKRKLALARTLLANPPILLLDEPTTGLDAISGRIMREFIKKTVKDSGKTVLYTTHYIEEAAQICDKIGILKQGKIIVSDSPEALRQKIKKKEIINLVVENITSTQIQQLASYESVIELKEKNNEILMPNQKALRIELTSIDQLPKIFEFLFEQKIRLINFKREEPTLEDAFIELTKKA